MIRFFAWLLLLNLFFNPAHASNKKKNRHLSEEKPYIIGSLLGRLGNYFFEVAATSALAWDHDAEAYFPDFSSDVKHKNSYYHHIFFRCKITPPSNTIDYEWSAPPFGYFPISFQSKMRISGYLQNENYFSHHRDRLLELFSPHPDDLCYVQKKYKKILKHPCTVSVHVRYYYAEKPDEDSFIQYDQEYFEKAMALFPDSALFVVTSDNMPFAKQNIPTEGKQVIFVEKEPYYIDFLLQSLCKHNIISNSSFSWWSAWLNQHPDKIVVRPHLWLAGYPDIGGPDQWIKIEARGMQEKIKK